MCTQLVANKKTNFSEEWDFPPYNKWPLEVGMWEKQVGNLVINLPIFVLGKKKLMDSLRALV